MPSVNLIPHELLLRRCKIRRVRMWLIIGGVTWIFASIPVIRELSAEYQLNSQSTAVAAMSDQLDHAHARRGQSAKRLLMLHQEVARAEKLRYKRLWTDMISVIADAIPERVWLIQLSTDPAKPPVSARTTAPLSPRRSAGSKAATTTPAGYDTLVGKAGPRRLLLEGQALGLEDIYALVDAVNDLGIFKNASIRSVRSDVAGGLKVTHFILECEW
ncbi:MAG: hypothetical protein IID34_02790 [Planctomycetes bacterium]|nr:hypothetical protein [Planctomycetota bacterium]MCH8963692.1 hypothetical protein [Planctomycetota bacterium]MCH8968434.1 hypothetical protein [Planctomycetota bacterium]